MSNWAERPSRAVKPMKDLDSLLVGVEQSANLLGTPSGEINRRLFAICLERDDQ